MQNDDVIRITSVILYYIILYYMFHIRIIICSILELLYIIIINVILCYIILYVPY